MKLKPCPFCGNKNVVMDCHHYDYLNDYLVLCNNLDCVAEGPTGRTEEKAAEAWNRRCSEKE
jgi:Lar family restriction alleviation protein